MKSIDFGGAFSLVFGVGLFLLGLDRGSNDSWTSSLALCPLLSSLVLMVVFLFVESKIASQPFLPARILFKRALFACSICNFFAYAGWLGIVYYLPLYWQAVESLSATQSALRLLPGTVAGVVGSLLAGWTLKRTGRPYMLTVTSYTVYAVGVIPIMMFAGWTSQSIWGIWAGTVLCGFFYNVGATVTLVALSKLFLIDRGRDYD